MVGYPAVAIVVFAVVAALWQVVFLAFDRVSRARGWLAREVGAGIIILVMGGVGTWLFMALLSLCR